MATRFGSLRAHIGLGFALAAVAALLSFFLSGAGEGWVSPLFASVTLWLLIPLTLALTRPSAGDHHLLLCAIALISIAADAWLIAKTFDELHWFTNYLRYSGIFGPLIMGAWLCLWFFWQVLLLNALIAGPKVGVRDNRLVLLAIAIIAIAADVWLIRVMLQKDLSLYVHYNGLLGSLIIAFWVCLWLSWQAWLVYALAGGFRRTAVVDD